MKNKPVKHKSTNTFRFVPFAERINGIDIRHAALYHIEHVNTNQPEDNETHFHIAVRKWTALNLTETFKSFRKEVHGVVTIEQLVHRKQDVLNAIEKYLLLDEDLCIQPLLELLVSLAKDLRDEFYPHFPKFLDILIQLLNTKNAEKLEWTLICLAFLFKVLKPYLKKDLATVLKKIIPLLSESKPQYINNFAAESFAFVARDVRDKKKFLSVVLHYLESHDDAISGCGHLFFEILKGVSNKFHSCSETFIPLLLELLKEDNTHQEILFKVLTQTLGDSLQCISPKEYTVFWSSTSKFIEASLKDKSRGLEYILRLSGQVIEHYDGKYLCNPQQFVILLVKIVCEETSENVLEVCSQIGALILLSHNVSLSQEHAGIIVKVLLQLPYPNILIDFVNNVVDYAQFELHILPPFLKYLVESDFEDKALQTLTKICLKKASLCKNGINLFEWVKYPIDLGKGLPIFLKHLEKAMKKSVDIVIKDPTKLLNLLICLPHIEKIDIDTCLPMLNNLIVQYLDEIEKYNIENLTETKLHPIGPSVRKILFVLGNALESAIHISSCKRMKQICDPNVILLKLLPLLCKPKFISALHIVDLYLTAYENENGLTSPLLNLVDSYITDNLCSPYHMVRLLSIHIYKLFESTDDLKKTIQVGSSTETLSIFTLCFEVESIKPSVQEYRTQINNLQKMAFNSIQYNMIKDTNFSLYPLKYMLGVLYMNFKLIWEPVTEFIAAYGNALPADQFWPVFNKQLQSSFENANKDKNLLFDDEIDTTNEINEIYGEYNNVDERPDGNNYKNLILKIMTNCIQVCEAKNRDIVVLFLDYIEKQFNKSDHMNALKVDVEIHDKNEGKETDDVDNETMDISDEIDLDGTEESVWGKIIFKTVINIMQVLAQFKNPRALYREPEFNELFLDFLKNKNPGLQKYALDCIINYKNKSILPYKDNLYNLVDDRKFKDALTQFKITEESENIQPNDREHVIPIILRILYGKMTCKLGADKKSGQSKRALVMRYLAGCNQHELKMFIEMAFSSFKQYMTKESHEIQEIIESELDLKTVVSPGKLHSILNLFEVVREYFGGHMKEQLLGEFFKILYAVVCTVNAVLSKDNVHASYVKVMKNLRVIALSTVRKLFEQFDKYSWTKDELHVIFSTLIWPMLTKLHIDGVHSPSTLLKLFNTWCLNPRYYNLLITCGQDSNICPISELFKLLLNSKTNPVVVNLILDMIEKLLTLTEDEDDNEIPPIITYHTIDILDENRQVNFGSKILIPHIPSILELMKRRFANSAKSNSVNKRDLLILSRATELVSDPELCDELLNILLPILVKKVCMNMAEENMEYAINTIINLLGHSKNPQQYIKKIAVLFNKVSLVEVRKLLLKALTSIASNAVENKEELTKLANIISEMNAFNKRWIEQPDFDRRLDAYKEIYKLSENSLIELNLAILIVNNCFYFIRTEKDIGLRDSAGLCLKRILPSLLMKFRSVKDGDILVRDTVLSLISSGIKDAKNEILRNECIALLGELVRECPDADVVLTNLAPLANKEDREVDFFENMCHLQMHRRVRALLKFCKVFKKVVTTPSPRTLTNIILPLATIFICNDKYSDKNTLIDACIDVISTSCKLLPWYHYELLLKLYLNKLRHTSEHQKQLIRIIIGILDSFHFDFSKVKDIELPKSLMNNTLLGTIAKRGRKAKVTENTEPVQVESDNLQEETSNNITDETTEDFEVTDDNTEEKLKVADEENNAENEVLTITDNNPAYERITTVSPSVAKRIIKSLSSGLLPQLNRSIGKLTEHDESHKVNRRRLGFERQEEDMLKVPIALALVKLLQKLPGDILRHQLPGIIIKLCSFLKSPLKQVRIAAKDIVKKIMLTVGTSYLGILLEHLTMLLTRGFQVHVLVSTIHSVLDALKADFKPGELNNNLEYILDVCTNDLFGSLSEEKEVEKLHYKTPEAKPSKKSYVTLTIVSQNITENYLINLVLPFKEVLQNHHSKKVVLKVQEALNHITTGLVANKFIDTESLFVFLHGIASESIPEFVLGAPKRTITEEQKQKILKAKPDCFIIQEAPKRNREVQARTVKTSARVNAYVLVEFSLNILYVILKREKVPKMDCVAFVDPLIPLLVDALNGDNVKVTTVAMKCITTLWTVRISTPSLIENVKEIVKTLFSILHKYATFEISKQNDNFHLVRNAFKAVTVLVRNVKYHTLESDQLKTLLLYAEEDCQNSERQSSSFNLLKAILEAKLVSNELHEVMEKISKICILNESARSREEARTIFISYLTNYTPGKRLERYLEFFVSQLNYELQHGRESSLKFLDMIINKVHAVQLAKHADFLLLSLGACMVNDSAPECRESSANAIESMLKKLPLQERTRIYDLVLKFFEETQPAHIELAAQLTTRFVNVEKDEFKTRLPTVLPIVAGKLLLLSNDSTSGRFVKLSIEQDNDQTDEEKQLEKDHCLIQLLNLVNKINDLCPVVFTDKFSIEMDEIAQQCQVFLAYPHLWVRLKAVKILGQMLNSIQAEELDKIVKGEDCDRGFLYSDTEDSLRSLVLDLCAQYTPGVSKDMAEQVTAVIFQLLKLVYSMKSFKITKVNKEEDPDSAKMNFRWIVFKTRKAINAEVAKAPLTTNIRTSIFTMWIHLISNMETEDLTKVLDVMLAPIVRELSLGDAGAPATAVKQLAGRLGKKLRRKIGDIEYGKMVAEAQTRLNKKRAERKKVVLQEKVHNPEKAAKRKLQLKEKKKISKKIKMEMLQGKRPRAKKRRAAEDIDLEDQLLRDD